MCSFSAVDVICYPGLDNTELLFAILLFSLLHSVTKNDRYINSLLLTREWFLEASSYLLLPFCFGIVR